jgi:DNA-binding winged helix-turn-helix (wHTH) protein
MGLGTRRILQLPVAPASVVRCPSVPSTRFQFGEFLVSPAQRTVRCGTRDVPLIPRYFDLLVLLLEQRHRVVTRQEIFDRVWADVVVSDGALSQAIRTIRRCLDDDPREPRFIRTFSRHGYQFVALDVRLEADDGPLRVDALPVVAEAPATTPGPVDRFAPLIDMLLRRPPYERADDEERREAAEQLHMLGTAEAIRRLDGASGHAEARAILRDARWDVPGAGEVSLLSSPAPWSAVAAVVALRLRRAARATSNRWGAAAIGGTAAGAIAGVVGGFALWLVPESKAGPGVILALSVVGATAGALGAAGMGAGLAAAEALARSARTMALVGCGALGGAVAGVIAHVTARALVSGMFGHDVPAAGGWFEGLVLGAAAGLGYALSTSPLPGGGLAGPRGGARLRASVITGLVCAGAATLLTMGGWHLVGASLDLMASAFQGSHVGLDPLARLLGEESLRPVTRTLVSAFEGFAFGAGLVFGLTHRPARP